MTFKLLVKLSINFFFNHDGSPAIVRLYLLYFVIGGDTGEKNDYLTRYLCLFVDSDVK